MRVCEITAWSETSVSTAAIQSEQWQGRGLAWAYHNRGVAYFNLGEYRRAIEDYDQALLLDPDEVNSLNGRGVAYRRLGQYRRAIEDLDEALLLDPGHVRARANRGIAYNALAWDLYLEGRNAEALDDVGRSLSDGPDSALAIDTRAHVLAALGRRREARAEFERVMKMGGAAQVRAYQEALARNGYYRGAIDGTYEAWTRAALGACLEAGCRMRE